MSSLASMDRGIVIAVTTYQRAALLPVLVRELRREALATASPTRILIVDNDPSRSAQEVAARLGVEYVAEGTPGIAAARQAALDAVNETQLVAMIDDDLLPEPGWLSGLIAAWRAHCPAAVMGFVRYVWPEDTEPWIASGGFMRRTRHSTGTELRSLSTGSVLLDVAQLRALRVRFDLSLGLYGGEDMQFGRDLLAAGGRIVASGESVARDAVPRERTTREFVRRRAIAQGQARVMLLTRDRRPVPRLLKRSAHFAGGAVRLMLFGIAARLATFSADARILGTLRRRTWFAQGRMLGAVGRGAPEYSRNETRSRARFARGVR